MTDRGVSYRPPRRDAVYTPWKPAGVSPCGFTVRIGVDPRRASGVLSPGKVFRRIRMNFLFAMVYNLVGVPVAAGALYPLLHLRLPPAFAGLAMALSSISVVLSSLSLRLYVKPEVRRCGLPRPPRPSGFCPKPG